MKQCIQLLSLALVLLAVPGTRAGVDGPSAEAAHIIEEFGLRQATKPISEHPDWNPQRVVVSLPQSFATRLPDLELNLVDMQAGY
jgi:hypothetical protein